MDVNQRREQVVLEDMILSGYPICSKLSVRLTLLLSSPALSITYCSVLFALMLAI